VPNASPSTGINSRAPVLYLPKEASPRTAEVVAGLVGDVALG
jgi:hypothetical protein